MPLPAAPTRPTSRRLDVQGLRAVAVLAVIVNHAIGWPRGGFLGVDVFFVISGFIITSLLLREHERTRRISFAAFYARRVKRIMPAALLVLAVTVALAAATGLRTRETALDAIASALFVSNWRFAAQSADYWGDTGLASPLQHFWSLSVEEQFYLVWPAVLVMAFVLAARLRTRPRAVVAVVLGAVLAASAVWGAIQTVQDPAVAYFLSLTRVWELAVGALVAVAAPWWRRIADSWRPALAWAGIAVLAASLWTADEQGMPVPGALVAVLATAAIIMAGTGERAPEIWPLSNRVSTYVGDLSFSLYLWHFPVIVFLAPRFEDPGRRFVLVVLAITAALSVATYHLVENPLRRAQWTVRPVRMWAGAAVALAAAVAVGAAAVTPPSPSAEAAETPGFHTQGELETLLADALSQTEWPVLSPGVADIAVDGMPTEDGAGCGATDLADDGSCAFPNAGATRTAVVMGDSTGIVLLPMIREALGDDWNVKGLTMAACYQVDVERWYDDAEHEASCEAHQEGALAEVERIDPELILVSDLYTGVWHIEPVVDALTGGGAYLWALETHALAERLKTVADDVVFVQSPPRREAVGECAVAQAGPARCVHRADELYREVTEGEQVAVAEAGAVYLTVEEWFCLDGACPAFVGSTLTMRDEMHVTRQFADALAPLLREKLDAAGALG